MSIYADSSFLVSLYVRDIYTQECLRRMWSRPRVWLTPFHELEFAHAVAQSAFRGRFTKDIAEEILRDFAGDRESGVWLPAEFPAAAFQAGVLLANLHGRRLGSRTLDTLHVAAAIQLGAKEFWTFDDRQSKLAAAVGLKVV